MCQDVVCIEVLSLLSAGSGCDFSEEPVWGCKPVTLGHVDVPWCPPELVAVAAVASLTICR